MATEMVDAAVNENDDEVLWGCAAIAKAAGRTPRQTYYLLESNRLPADKIGGQWMSTRRRLRTFFAGAGRV